ncbi:MAG: transglycosylase SLT domain-containing protein, partial [Myxococcota bacterium]
AWVLLVSTLAMTHRVLMVGSVLLLSAPVAAEDATAYFASGALKEAKAAFDKGQYGKAQALLRGIADDDLPARFLRAQAALEGKDDALAAADFLALAERYTPLADRCAMHAGEALERLGELDRAGLAYARVPAASQRFVHARLALARVLARAKDPTGAAAALQPLLKGHGRGARSDALSRLAQLSDGAARREALLALWAENPGTQVAARAERALGARTIPWEDKVRRVEELVELGRDRAALTYLGKLKQLPLDLECRARVAEGRALRRQREHSRVIELLAPLADVCTEPETQARLLYVLASSRSILRTDDAVSTYEQLVARFPLHRYADDARFFAADLEWRAGRAGAALEHLEAVGRLHPEGDYAGEALFRAFWISRETQARLDLLDALEALPSASETQRAQARYWRARSLEAADPAAAVRRFADVALSHPATFYATMALARLQELDARAASQVSARLVIPALPAPRAVALPESRAHSPRLAAGVELFRLGFPEAKAELLAAAGEAASSDELRLAFLLLEAMGEARAAHSLARQAVRGPLSRMNEENAVAWRLAFPGAFRASIERHSQAADLDPNLLQALVREESSFEPSARSGVGAVGLTQLMPATAAAVAHRLRLGKPSERLLARPELNLRLGAHYLSSLLARFDGDAAQAVAGYNAGPTRVAGWARGGPLDVWVEEIPIAQTRNYVKRVLSSWRIYELAYLYGGSRLAERASRAEDLG